MLEIGLLVWVPCCFGGAFNDVHVQMCTLQKGNKSCVGEHLKRVSLHDSPSMCSSNGLIVNQVVTQGRVSYCIQESPSSLPLLSAKYFVVFQCTTAKKETNEAESVQSLKHPVVSIATLVGKVIIFREDYSFFISIGSANIPVFIVFYLKSSNRYFLRLAERGLIECLSNLADPQ